LTEKKKNT